MLAKLAKIALEFKKLETQMSDPVIIADQKRYKQTGQRYQELKPIVQLYEQYQALAGDLNSALELQQESADPELAAEVDQLQTKQAALLDQLKIALLPPDPYAGRNVIVELRAGAGGDEAAIFVGDLYRMYSKYSEAKDWQIELISSSASDAGGFKEIIFAVKGEGAFADLQYESGVHRVQRVPKTESQDRIHTSTITCAILPEAEEVDLVIKDEDLRIDVFRSGGHGGQSVNTTDSAVRITHLRTGMVVSCQDEKSQLKNKQKAMKVLRSRLLLAEEERAAKTAGALRRSQIKTGDRSEKIRTYNYPQNRVTDHRIKKSWNNLAEIIEGHLEPVIEELKLAHQMERLAAG